MAAAATPDYTQMKRPELVHLCADRGLQGTARRTKRELASLLEAADRELADLRWRRRMRRQAVAQEQEQQQQQHQSSDLPADSFLADSMLPSTTPMPLQTFAAHIRRALLRGFPPYPILTAVLLTAVAASNKQKVEESACAKPQLPPQAYYIEECQLYPALPPTSPLYFTNDPPQPQHKRHDD